jgi:ELP3 family radical SAM enzyme/protein acetyltransferase
MPNLPGSTVEIDDAMFEKLLGIKSKKYINYCNEDIVLTCPELQVDQWKLYPTTITEFTDIKKWYEEGKYIPYSNHDLLDLLIKIKKLVFPWIRLNRVIRDIPNDYVIQNDYYSNARQFLQHQIEKDGWYCACQRCREVKNGLYDPDNSITVVRKYNASASDEYFISRESKDKRILYGFVRLRLTRNQASWIFPELEGCAFIRELHVYGQVLVVGTNNKNITQHSGIGKLLMNKAEEIAKLNKYSKIAVIAGEGTRGYYEKIGYTDNHGDGYYMIKIIK